MSNVDLYYSSVTSDVLVRTLDDDIQVRELLGKKFAIFEQYNYKTHTYDFIESTNKGFIQCGIGNILK